MKKCILFLTILVGLAACIDEPMDHGPQGSKLFAGDTLPLFQVQTIDAAIIGNKQRTTPLLFVVFFHTECKDCQKELPIIEKLYRECRNDSLWQLVCIGRDENADQVIRYWHDNGFTMPVAPQPNRDIYNRFAYSGVPMIYLTQKENVILAVYDDKNMASYDELKQWITLYK